MADDATTPLPVVNDLAPERCETFRGRRDLTLEFRMLAKIRKMPSGCWVWLGGVGTSGYGRTSTREGDLYAHRVAYSLWVGDIPGHLTIDHLCKNKLCCNPGHLEAVTAGENSLRGDGACSQHARKIVCLRGHPLAGDNLRRNNRGDRVCVTCKRQRDVTRRAKKSREKSHG